MTARPIRVFFSYAHADAKLSDKLVKHLALLKNQGIIEDWDDRKIPAGANWANQIDARLNTAPIILLLISADFMASPYCYTIEMKRAVERHDRGEACVIPVILRPCLWEGAPFSKLQALPKNGKPVTDWSNQDKAFLDVAKGIQDAVKNLKARP